VFIVQLVVLAIIDAVILFLFVFSGDNLIDAMTSDFIIIPGIITTNAVLATLLYLLKQRRVATFVFINILIAQLLIIGYQFGVTNILSIKNFSTIIFLTRTINLK